MATPVLPRSRRRRLRVLCAVLVAGACALPVAQAQDYAIDLSQLDPALVMSAGADVIRRAPDESIDRLFQAVHVSSRSDAESRVLCSLFEPDADRDVAAFQRAVDRLQPASRERFATAFTEIALLGMQAPPQAFDAGFAQKVVQQSAIAAAMLHDGFMAAISSNATDPASRGARCTAFRQVIGVLRDKPLLERAAATRWLLQEGLALVADSQRR